ncbi:probable transcription factor At4g00610 [Capsella rubella]|uniref:probable transcription factor At4g00610 n=1 Tax=Capsella rubella TaxID=81985 RepID=UPI000CD57554|nr:probable transcription factor At4g00610 [Capsella rubella]
MAKKKQSQPLVTPSTAKKPLPVSSTAKKQSQVASTSKQPPENPSPMKKKPTEIASPVKKPPVLALASTSKNKKQPEPSTDSESESETEGGDSEAEPEQATPLRVAASPPKKKRQSEAAAATEANPSKRAKTEGESGTETNNNKNSLFKRIWSEEDEILLLKGMVDYRSSTGKTALEDVNGYFETVKNSISFEVSISQFSSKVKSLKGKYLKKITKMKDAGESSVKKDPHDRKCFELAKIVLGDYVGSTKTAVVKSTRRKIKLDNGSSKAGDAEWFGNSFIIRAITSYGPVADEEAVMGKWSLVPVKMKKKIEEKYKLLKADELKVFLLKNEILNDVSSEISKFD